MKHGRAMFATALVALTACSLTTDLGGFSSGGPVLSDAASGGEAGPSADAGETGATGATGATGDAGLDVDAAPAVLLPGGGVLVAANAGPYAAGAAQQHHVHFAQNLGAFVVFYLAAGDRNAVHTKISSDFLGFADGPSIPLPRPHDGDGRNLDVAYANIGSADVFHVAIAIHDQIHLVYRTRGRFATGGTLAFDPVSELAHTDNKDKALDPDGVSVAILDSHKVVFSSGYVDINGHQGNANILAATVPDDGSATWTSPFAAPIELQTVTNYSNARSIVAYPEGAGFLWEGGEAETRPQTLRFSIFDGTKWSTPAPVAFTSGEFDVNDWSQVRTNDAKVHAAHFGPTGGYEHRTWYGAAGHAGSPLPALDHSVGDGLVLLARGAVPHAYALSAADKSIRETSFDGATSNWLAWTTLAGSDAARSHLSGNGDVLLWQRGADLGGVKLGQ